MIHSVSPITYQTHSSTSASPHKKQEVVLTEGAEEAVAMETAFRFKPRRGCEPLDDILHKLLYIRLTVLQKLKGH